MKTDKHEYFEKKESKKVKGKKVRRWEGKKVGNSQDLLTSDLLTFHLIIPISYLLIKRVEEFQK